MMDGDQQKMVPLHEHDNEKALFKNGLILTITSDNPRQFAWMNILLD
jgi:hypothetical protein